MNHVELFAGIGGFRKAMDYISKDLDMKIKTIAYSENDTKATMTYCANFETAGETAMGDIVNFANDTKAVDGLENFDLISGGFPCQPFSVMGGQAGFGESRGQMFFRIMDIIDRRHPKFVLLENVRNLAKHNNGETIQIIEQTLEDAGYIVHHDVFNTSDFGLPQKRSRIVFFARLKSCGDFVFDTEHVKDTFSLIDKKKCSLSFYDSVINVLDKNVDEKYYLSEKIKPTILSDGSANFKANSDIDQNIARTLTATMNKMHRACQDNYYSDRYILSDGRDRPSSYLSKTDLAKLRIRKITPKEAFMLQGFPSDFSDNASRIGVSDGALYKQAGNAVSVNTIYAILYYLIINHYIY